MKFAITEFEYLRFVNSGDELLPSNFIATCKHYWSSRKQGKLTSPPDINYYIFGDCEKAIASVLAHRTTEWSDATIYSESPLSEAQFEALLFKLAALTEYQLECLIDFLNISIANDVVVVNAQNLPDEYGSYSKFYSEQ